MQRRVFAGVALLTVLVATAPARPAGKPMDLTPANFRKTAPDLALANPKGASIRLSGYKGRVVLLDFWATWCTGCKVEIPWYMEFQKKYKDRGLSVVGVAMDADGWKSVKPFLEKTPVNYTIVVGNSDLARIYGVDSMPMTLLIDRGGKIAASHVGMVDKDAFEREIQIVLHDGRKAPAK